jgi:hypothetical protein
MKATPKNSVWIVLCLFVFGINYAAAESDNILEVGKFSGFSLNEKFRANGNH